MSSVTLQYVDQAQQPTETDTVRVEELEQIVDTAEGVIPANGEIGMLIHFRY